MKFTLYADGGSRGNPGPAGSGAVVFDSSEKRVVEVSDYVGITTNNVAEYEALIRGLTALSLAYPEGYFADVELLVRMDSKLVIEQLKGAYKVKREFNKDADALANEAMDRGG